MTSLVKDDLTGDIIDRDDSYFCTIYNRANKTKCVFDTAFLSLDAGFFKKGLKPKWQQYNTETKKYEDVS